MEGTKINIIAAVGENRALGKDNKLIWSIKSDLKRFRELTTGHPVIMGRKTFESIGKALPNRTNIVITRNKDYKAPECIVVDSLDKAIKEAGKKDNEIFIIGGGEVYKESIGLADRLYLTVVKDSPEADVFFPDWSDFKKVTEKTETVDPNSGLSLTYLILEK